MRKIIIILSALFANIVLYGSDLQFRRYTNENGLPSNCVRDIVQDDKGYVWLATDGGVIRFDGYHFRQYDLQSQDNHDDNFALALHNHNGDIWLGTDSHLYKYDDKTDRFNKVALNIDGNTVDTFDAHHITHDNVGNIWISSYGNGVYRISADYKARLYDFDVFNDYVSMVYADTRGNIWAISNQGDGVLMLYDKASDSFRPYDVQSLKYNALAMAEDQNHNLWLGTWDKGLVCFNPVNGMILSQTPESERHFLRHIHSLKFLPDSRLMVGSDSGLGIYDMTSGNFKRYISSASDPYSISDIFVYPIMVDKEGGVWVGTFYGGVNYLRPDLKIFDRYLPSDSPLAIGGSIISDIREDRKGNIWMASDDGGLIRYNPESDSFSQVNLSGALGSGANSHYNLHALCFDGDDLWIGSYASGVFLYDTNTGTCRHFSASDDDATSLMTHSSYAICRDRRSNVWVATGDWVNLYNRGTDDFKRVKDLNAQIVDIVEDVDGSLWFATQGAGLWRYDPVKGDWRNYTFDSDRFNLPHDHVNCICVDKKGVMYVATVQGLCRYDRAADRFVSLDLGLPLTSILSVVDDDGDLWMTTDMGLVKYVHDSGCEVFTKSDGLSSASFMPNSMLKSSSGKIYVGTRFGVTAFYPYNIKSNMVAPNVVFTSLEIPNEINHGPGDHLPYDINHIEKIVLHPEDYTFSISFAALSFTNPEKNQYKYRLEGFDTDWISVGSDNKATYTNLPPGNYTFRVKASNSDNIWNDEGAAVRIEVLAPWYKSKVMMSLYALLIVGSIVLGVRYLMKRKEQKHKVEIHRINSDKEIEVYQAKLSFFTMIAHEIRTPVSLIIGPLEKIMRSSEKVTPAMSHDLDVIERNSQRLLSLVNQLLDFKKVEESGITLRFRPTRLKPLLINVTDRFRPSMEQKGIILEITTAVDDDFTADVDAEAITKMISNLLNNARKFTKDFVSVSLSLNTASDMFVIVVTDNGVGISKENQTKVFRPFYQIAEDESRTKGGTGLGLSIVQNVVNGHGGDIKIDSAIDCGTSFIVTIPIHQAVIDTASVADSDVADEKAIEVVPEKKVNTDDKPCMLVVDDNEELATFIAGNFEAKYNVVTAHDGIEALKILKETQVAFIISDWMMPRLDGVQLCKAVRDDRNICHIPFVLLTAKTDNKSRIEGLNIGADAYVDKPFSIKVLEARVDNLVMMRKVLREKFSRQPLEPIASVATTQADSEILTMMTAVIEENFSNPDLDIDFLAAKLDISRSGLYNKIRALIETTPNELIRITRLKHAAKLLSEGQYRINEVCYMVGFNSTSYFTKCFQKQFGMTPTDFITTSGRCSQSSAP